MRTVTLDQCNTRPCSAPWKAHFLKAHGSVKRSALRRTLCQQEPAQKLLTQTGHCSTAVAEQLAFLACQSNGLVHLFEETACSHLLELQQAVDFQTASNSVAAPTAVSLETLLQQQLHAARFAEQQRKVEEIIYIWSLHSLSQGSMTLRTSLDAQQQSTCQQASPVSQLMLSSVMSQAAADAIAGLVASTFESSDASSGTLRAHIDRTQAARLYAGNIEYGYFVREMEARCQQAGVAAGKDADQLITFAASLPEEQLRAASQVHSRQAWHAAVRHTGLLFQLPKPPLASAAAAPSAAAASEADSPPTPSLAEASHAGDAEAAGNAACLDATDTLPYPQLAQTTSSANFAPAAHLAEHYSPPGAAEEAARTAASKQARGWQISDPQPKEFLPEPDLIMLQLSTLKQLLLEAAAFGCMLWESEKAVQKSGYPLTSVQAASANVAL